MTEAAAQTSANTQQSSQETQSTPTNSGFAVPEAYADRGWAKDIKSPDDLWKLTDNAQSLIGKRPAGIPTKDAAPEEWEKFYTALGRPDAPDKYEIQTTVELPEGADLSKYEANAKQIAHKLGLSNEKANQLWNDYLSMELEAVGEARKGAEAQQAEHDKRFDELTKSLFGDKYGEASAQAQSFLKSTLPADLVPVVQRLSDNDPEALVALIKVAHSAESEIAKIRKEYGAEDKLSSGGQAAGEGLNEINKKIIEAKARYQKADVFSQDRKDAEAEIESLREKLKRLAR